jgi:hypothetical protein
MYTSPHQARDLQQLGWHEPVLLLDATLNLQVHVCGIPGCKQLLEKGEQLLASLARRSCSDRAPAACCSLAEPCM